MLIVINVPLNIIILQKIIGNLFMILKDMQITQEIIQLITKEKFFTLSQCCSKREDLFYIRGLSQNQPPMCDNALHIGTSVTCFCVATSTLFSYSMPSFQLLFQYWSKRCHNMDNKMLSLATCGVQSVICFLQVERNDTAKMYRQFCAIYSNSDGLVRDW